MFLSVLIGTHNEGRYVVSLLDELVKNRPRAPFSYEIVVVDDFSTDPETLAAFDTYASEIRLFKHALADHYGNHKTYMNSVCQGEWILNLDADEVISRDFFFALKELVDANPTYDGYRLPRVNTVEGLTLAHVHRWRWPISSFDDIIQTTSKPMDPEQYALIQAAKLIDHEDHNQITYRIPIVAWPDYQLRLYRRLPSVKWVGKVHEQLTGLASVTLLPADRDYAIWHHKQIARQEQQNSYYDTLQRT